ncbi:MAG TPA: hypothetical protein VJJ82_03890 [Candidatus Nanoarchaeia archaeon]|nr:hypothetical protein [Candidatus Nanoarchaeia archaeon]
MRRQYTFNTGDVMYHLGIKYAHPNVLTAGSSGRIAKFVNYLEKPEVIESDRKLVTVHGTYKGMLVTATTTGMGPASVSITLPEVIEACDADKMTIIRLGTSGGLRKHQKIGDFVVTTDVEHAESTSEKIMGKGYFGRASPAVVDTLVDFAQNFALPSQKVYQGTNRTTDDIYFDAMETKKLAKEGRLSAITVSMEAGPHFALRDRYNQDQKREIRAGELLVVSDIVVAEEHPDMTEFLKNKDKIEDAHIRIGLEALLALQR